jgi:hypothetical protein
MSIPWQRIGANVMSKITSISIKSENLLNELDGWKLIATANKDELNNDPFLKEFLAFKLDITQGFIEELQFWEEVGNDSKCHNAIENAQFFLGQIQILMDRFLSDQQKEVLFDSQKELNVTIYVPTFHEYVFNE